MKSWAESWRPPRVRGRRGWRSRRGVQATEPSMPALRPSTGVQTRFGAGAVDPQLARGLARQRQRELVAADEEVAGEFVGPFAPRREHAREAAAGIGARQDLADDGRVERGADIGGASIAPAICAVISPGRPRIGSFIGRADDAGAAELRRRARHVAQRAGHVQRQVALGVGQTRDAVGDAALDRPGSRQVVASVGSSAESARFQRSVRSRSQAISPTVRPGRRALKANSSPVQKLKRDAGQAEGHRPDRNGGLVDRSSLSGWPPPGRSDISKAEPMRRPEAEFVGRSRSAARRWSART